MTKLLLTFFLLAGHHTFGQNSFASYQLHNDPVTSAKPGDSISVWVIKMGDNLYFLQCVNGFGGGNVTASVGDDGILIADDMFASMHNELKAALKSIADKPVRIVLNSHFHGDHIQGNMEYSSNAVIIAQENVRQRLIKNNKASAPTTGMLPMVTFNDSITIHFNGEDIRMLHFPNCHTDGDAVIYFTRSKVLHLGDMFFFEMFPAIYSEGGGNIKQLIAALDKLLLDIPADAHVVPGHGNPATMKDLADYVTMLKETVSIVETNTKAGKTLEQMKAAKVLAKYDALGSGGAQTTDQYLAMLYKLLVIEKQ
jgi:cyclase